MLIFRDFPARCCRFDAIIRAKSRDRTSHLKNSPRLQANPLGHEMLQLPEIAVADTEFFQMRDGVVEIFRTGAGITACMGEPARNLFERQLEREIRPRGSEGPARKRVPATCRRRSANAPNAPSHIRCGIRSPAGRSLSVRPRACRPTGRKATPSAAAAPIERHHQARPLGRAARQLVSSRQKERCQPIAVAPTSSRPYSNSGFQISEP